MLFEKCQWDPLKEKTSFLFKELPLYGSVKQQCNKSSNVSKWKIVNNVNDDDKCGDV